MRKLSHARLKHDPISLSLKAAKQFVSLQELSEESPRVFNLHTNNGHSSVKKKKSIASFKKGSQRVPEKEPMTFTLLPPISDMNSINTRGISLQSPPKRKKKKPKVVSSFNGRETTAGGNNNDQQMDSLQKHEVIKEVNED